MEAEIVAESAGVALQRCGPLFEAVAEELLRRLAEHRFGHWPSGIDHVLTPAASALATYRPAAPSPSPAPAPTDSGTPISAVFADWRQHSRATAKAKDEFAATIDRFVSTYGDMPVENIAKTTVVDFRRLLERLPYRPRKALSSLPLREQVELAAAQKLRIVSPDTAKKNLQALRTTLAHARDEMLLIEHNPADGVQVDTSANVGDDRFPFTGVHLQRLFSLPVMTDPSFDTGSALFWFMLLAPFTGCRCSELACLRPGNVRREDDIWFIAIERDAKRQRLEEAAEGRTTKRVKTKTSLRKVPLHPVLIAAGFLGLVERQRERNAEWLFDDLVTYEKYGDRAKNISRRLMALIRAAGINDAEYVFHSFRHTLKGKLRNDRDTKEEISDLLTGHSFAESVGRCDKQRRQLPLNRGARNRGRLMAVNEPEL